jgi:hypothetical protein
MAFRYNADHRGRKSNGVTRITTPHPACCCCALCGRVRREEQCRSAASGDGGGGRGWDGLMKDGCTTAAAAEQTETNSGDRVGKGKSLSDV